MLALRIVPNRALPLLRNQIYLGSREIKRWWTKTGPAYDVPLITPDSAAAADTGNAVWGFTETTS